MPSLNFDISLSTCSIAVFDGDECRYHRTFTPKTRHSAEFLPALTTGLESCGFRGRDLDEIIYTNGPGSFTGLKVSASIAKGFGYALDIPVYPVSTLAALALNAPVNDDPVVCLIHAKIGELFAAVYSRRNGMFGEIRPEAAFTLDDALLLVQAFPGASLIGGGITGLSERLSGEYTLVPEEDWPIDARNLRPLARPLAGTDRRTLLAVGPNYLRPPHVEQPSLVPR